MILSLIWMQGTTQYSFLMLALCISDLLLCLNYINPIWWWRFTVDLNYIFSQALFFYYLFFFFCSWKKSLHATVSAATNTTNSLKSTSLSLFESRSFMIFSTSIGSFWDYKRTREENECRKPAIQVSFNLTHNCPFQLGSIKKSLPFNALPIRMNKHASVHSLLVWLEANASFQVHPGARVSVLNDPWVAADHLLVWLNR